MRQEEKLSNTTSEYIGNEIRGMVDRIFSQTEITKEGCLLDLTLVRYFISAEIVLYYLLEELDELEKVNQLAKEYWE